MESIEASSTGPEIPPGSGADSASGSGSAETSAESSAGYGPAGPLGVESVWTAPVVEPPEPTSDADPAEADPADRNDADSPNPDPSESDSAGPDSTDPDPDPAGSDSEWLFSEAWASSYFGDDPGEPGDPDVRVRSSSEPPALTGRLRMASVGGLDACQVVDALKDLDEARSWLDAQEAKVVTRALDLQTEHTRHDPREWGYEKTVTATEISAALRVPERTAGFLVEHSTLLTRYCPATLEALETGKLSKRHAWAVVEETTSIPDTDATTTAAFEARLIGMASLTTVAKFRQQANRLREELHPETISIRQKKAVKERGVFLTPSYDGMAWLEAYLPVDQAAGIFHRIDTAARNLQGPDETRTLTQLRADVLADVLTSAGATGHMSSGPDAPFSEEHVSGASRGDGSSEPDQTDRSITPDGINGINGLGGTPGKGGSAAVGEAAGRGGAAAYWGVQAKVFVTVPVMTLLGGDAPGELEGYGPIDPDTARKLAGNAPSFTRILTHPFTGARLGADATTYRVPTDLQDAVRVRDRTCRHPGCNRLAVFCELDHTTPWSQGGKTSYGNLAALCKRHHKLKSEGYWHYRQPEPGTIIAISPAGETYLTRPDPPPTPNEDPPPF